MPLTKNALNRIADTFAAMQAQNEAENSGDWMNGAKQAMCDVAEALADDFWLADRDFNRVEWLKEAGCER